MVGSVFPVLAATAPTLLDRCAGVYFDTGLFVRRCGYGSHPILYLGGHRHEGLLHIRRVLSASLEKGNSQMVCIFLEYNAGIPN